MRDKIIFALGIILGAPLAATAQDCEPVIIDTDTALIIQAGAIEPGGQATRELSVSIRNEASGANNGTPCSATLRLARTGPVPSPDFPPYSVFGPGNQQVEILPDPGSGGTVQSDVNISAVTTDPTGRLISLRFTVPTEWGVRAGTYTDQLELLLLDETGAIADRSALTNSIVIPPAVSVRLVGAVLGDGTSGPAQIDLGNLSRSSETRSNPFGARVFSTAPYSIEFSSNNLGYLRHEAGEETIAYRLYYDGGLVNLGGNTEIGYPDHTGRDGSTRSMSIVVPPVVALAGNYSDRITITVTTL